MFWTEGGRPAGHRGFVDAAAMCSCEHFVKGAWASIDSSVKAVSLEFSFVDAPRTDDREAG